MRTIKFRGIDAANGEWTYGSLVIVDDSYHILDGEETTVHDYNKVDEKTAGQFTGLHDMVGNEIYEGDILKEECELEDYFHVVEWGSGTFVLNENYRGDYSPIYLHYHEYEVIGNIHDNPELNK